ncbi:hypothetical protein K458DRAFT_421488 [Lentithecium fluviatile CBS 122367]|uniref:Uncharacterized protein n=1 Tax=Lentithecium fluviatile CBS 122367 TaxID=1168545 RepID=A0A6G1IQP1_9PLEO|nr:hypothetical protein K458DRAFT_421488 [Lentithecium fluviatile CBS 122367]
MDPTSSKSFPTHLIVTDISTPSQPSNYIPLSTLTSESTYTSDLSTVYRVAWAGDKTGLLPSGPNTERFHEVIVKGEELCEVRTWECMGGVLAHAVKWMYRKTLETRFAEWCGELKGYGEKRWREERGEISRGGGE